MKLQFVRSKNSLVTRVMVAQWALLAVTIVLETLVMAVRSDAETVARLAGCLCILLVLTLLSLYVPEHKDRRFRLCLALMETLLVGAASVLGTYRWISPLYLVLTARAALFVDRQDLKIVVATACTLQVAWYFVNAVLSVGASAWQAVIAPGLMSAFMMTASTCALTVVVGRLMLSLVNEQRLSRENEVLAAELERTRIAREIHDTLGHSLTSLKIQLELAGRLLDIGDGEARNAVSQAEQLAARSLTDTRVALQSLRNNDFNFERALDELTRELRTSGAVQLHVDVAPTKMSNAVGYQLYRAIQESLTNTLKHARASEVFVSLCHENGAVRLEVRDNGVGFDTASGSDGYGLQGLKERISSLNGSVMIHTARDKGTTVSVTVPLSN